MSTVNPVPGAVWDDCVGRESSGLGGGVVLRSPLFAAEVSGWFCVRVASVVTCGVGCGDEIGDTLILMLLY